MNFEKFTVKAQEAIANSQAIASENGHQTIEDFHLARALLDQQDGVVIPVLKKMEINIEDLNSKIDGFIKDFHKVTGQNVQVFMSPEMNNILNNSFKEAEKLKDEYVSTEHLLIALSASSGKIGQLLKQYGVSRDAIYKILKQIRGNQRITDQNPEDKYQALQRFGKDITELARKQKLDPCDRP